MHLFEEAARLVAERQNFVLCTVASTLRSAPRDGGARMIVRGDGQIVGTIGGGPLEATVRLLALDLLRDPQRSTELFHTRLTAAEESLGMKCGGEVSVLLDLHRAGPVVHLFGAGHVGVSVAAACRVAGLSHRVYDDRPDRLALLPAGTASSPLDGEEPSRSMQGIGPGDFVVIVTRCHDIDERVLGAAMQSPARYIGLIGSKAKTATLFANLRRAGRPDPAVDARVYSPIGLSFGSKEPGEIALSVVAELLSVRDGVDSVAHRRWRGA